MEGLQSGEKEFLYQRVAEAYKLLYETVKERKIKEILRDIQNGEKYGKHQRV